MKRAQIPRILLLALLASAAAWAAPAADQRAGAAPALVSGVYWVTFSVNPDPAMAAGGVIACKARMAPNLAAFEDPNPGVAPVESAAGVVKLVGSGRASSPVLCMVQVPFAWRVSDPGSGVQLSYEIVAVSDSGGAAVRVGQEIGVAYPEVGGTENVHLKVAF